MRRPPVLILGAGIGGLSAAIHLAVKGYRVTILEQNPAVGGKMAEIRQDGFRWDTGPSVITMRDVFEDLFTVAGRRLEDYLSLLPVEPITRYFWPDGTRLELSRDLSITANQIAALSPRDLEGYLAFLAQAARLHRITAPVFTYGPPPSLSSFRLVSLREVLSVDPFHTLQWSIERHVRHPHLRQLLGRFATYVGASPYRAPAILSVIAHVELTGGVWYPQGGVYQIARALEQLARELEVEIRLNTRVRQIRLKGQQVLAIVLEDGETLPAPIVISNLDVFTIHSLIQADPNHPSRATLKSKALSCSGMILLLGVEGEFPHLAHHNIFFSSDYRREFEHIFDERRLPDDPTLYVCITSRTDPSHAPPGCENWFVMVNAPPLPDQMTSSPFDSDQISQWLIQILEQRGLNLRGRIRTKHLITPFDLQQRTGAYRGALYGLSYNDRLAPFKRPPNRSPIRGLYYVGGTTHPGGGVPMVILSGKLVARMVAEDTADTPRGYDP